MSEIVIEGLTYTLRAAAPTPVGGSSFILQTFMAEETDVYTYLYTEDLPSSEAFRGQGGEMVSASFNRLQNTSNESFSGSKVRTPRYVPER